MSFSAITLTQEILPKAMTLHGFYRTSLMSQSGIFAMRDGSFLASYLLLSGSY
jgi:hypothetical protein